jgi:hypothetical protein
MTASAHSDIQGSGRQYQWTNLFCMVWRPLWYATRSRQWTYLQLQPRLDEVGGEDAGVRNHAGGSRAHPVPRKHGVARLTCALTGHIVEPPNHDVSV